MIEVKDSLAFCFSHARQRGYFLLAAVNQIDQEEPARIENDQEMTILKEMNDLQQFRELQA